jgi:Hsp20/alpha crystallin family
VAGRPPERDDKAKYLYRGIAGRPFERRFNLADYVEVEGAFFEDGLLDIDLVRREPEAMKPRRIEIGVKKTASWTRSRSLIVKRPVPREYTLTPRCSGGRVAACNAAQA